MAKKSYDRFDPPERGDDTTETIFSEVGRALDRWEQLEEELASLFAVFCFATDNKSKDSITAAYGMILAFQSRKDMLLAAAEMFFHHIKDKNMAKTAKDLIVLCGSFASRRNEIAHGMARRLTINHGYAKNDDKTFYLMPAFYNSRKSKAPYSIKNADADAKLRVIIADMEKHGLGKFKYNSEQIRAYGDHFLDLRKRTIALRENILALKKPSPDRR